MTVFDWIANIWVGGMALLLFTLVPYELFFGSKDPHTAAGIACASSFWPLVLLVFLVQQVGALVKQTWRA